MIQRKGEGMIIWVDQTHGTVFLERVESLKLIFNFCYLFSALLMSFSLVDCFFCGAWGRQMLAKSSSPRGEGREHQ